MLCVKMEIMLTFSLDFRNFPHFFQHFSNYSHFRAQIVVLPPIQMQLNEDEEQSRLPIK